MGEESVGVGPHAVDSRPGALECAGEGDLGVGMDEDQGDGVGVRVLAVGLAPALEGAAVALAGGRLLARLSWAEVAAGSLGFSPLSTALYLARWSKARCSSGRCAA
ncbi:hypothetical protein GCM10010245_80550 [Streptomyces spectabilis]|nr:hypothetical protein GCM10010245_80550 [Streptomyces spectabilis]